MAYANDVRSARVGAAAGLIETLRAKVGDLFTSYFRYRDYARAEAQLRKMTDRELDDIGISRAEIHKRVWADYNAR